jgi:hypothetical protein
LVKFDPGFSLAARHRIECSKTWCATVVERLSGTFLIAYDLS